MWFWFINLNERRKSSILYALRILKQENICQKLMVHLWKPNKQFLRIKTDDVSILTCKVKSFIEKSLWWFFWRLFSVFFFFKKSNKNIFYVWGVPKSRCQYLNLSLFCLLGKIYALLSRSKAEAGACFLTPCIKYITTFFKKNYLH